MGLYILFGKEHWFSLVGSSGKEKMFIPAFTEVTFKTFADVITNYVITNEM